VVADLSVAQSSDNADMKCVTVAPLLCAALQATLIEVPLPMEMMHMIDSNKDGKISKAEWVAYQKRVFTALDKNQDGFLDAEEFFGHPKIIDFATGGYSRGLETKQMFGKIDANGDGRVSRDEYINFQVKIFEMMDTNKKQELGVADFIVKTH
jgi:hypothetical protein